MSRREKAELTNAELAKRSAQRARINRVIGIIFLSLAGIYALGFLALGSILGDWHLIILAAGVMLASSGLSMLTSAQREHRNASRFQRLAESGWTR